MRVMISFSVMMLLMSGLSGCETQQQPIRLGTNIWPGYEPLYLAHEIGELDADRIRLVGYPSATEVISAFRNQAIEAASLTLDEALQLIDNGLPIKVILVHDVSHGADAIVARPDIRQFSDLEGRTIAVESTALGAFVITRALQQHGLDISAVELRHLDVNQHEAAYRAGEVDAAVTFEPFNTRLKELGAHEIFTSREMPGEIIDVLVVHEAVYKTRLHDLRHLTQSWFAALDYLEAEPLKAAEIMGKRLKLSDREVLASYEGMELPTQAQNIAMLLEGNDLLHELARIMSQHQLIRNEIELDQVLSTNALYQEQ